MNDLKRNDLELLSQHSDIQEKEVQKILNDSVYPGQSSWEKFIQIVVLTLGVGFIASGIIFFFAYNWEQLDKFIKLGIVQGLVILATISVLSMKVEQIFKNIILTGAAVLIGVMFAVFGQVYQTGANAYDFFLAWTIFTTLWVLVSNFPPLWLLYIGLGTLTTYLYWDQVAKHWEFIYLAGGLFIINATIFLICTWINKQKKGKIPSYFNHIIAISGAIWCTISNINWIFDSRSEALSVVVFSTVLFYGLGMWHGIKEKNIFLLGLIPFSLIIIFSGLILNAMEHDEVNAFLLVSAFIVVAVSAIIWILIKMQRRMKNEH